MEYIAAMFPGGLVAFDHDLLQSLPSFSTLRIYCAGIWHNAAFCALCAFGLLFLPAMLFPLYKHGENLVVVDVPSMSPLFGYLSPGDVIVSVDGIQVHRPSEWLELAAILDKQNSETSNASLYLGGSRRFYHGKALTEGSICLDAKDIVKLKKCGDGWLTTSDTDIKSDCVCSQGESCLQAIQSPGISWTEITYRRTSSQNCTRPVHLFAYQPRWLFNVLGKSFPDILERSLICTFHVSLALVLLNSLPVYYLDGESILESSLQSFTWLSRRKKKKALQICLILGSLLSFLAFVRIFLIGFFLNRS